MRKGITAEEVKNDVKICSYLKELSCLVISPHFENAPHKTSQTWRILPLGCKESRIRDKKLSEMLLWKVLLTL